MFTHSPCLDPQESLISKERHQKSLTYGHVTKLCLESAFQHEWNKQMKKKNKKKTWILSRILRFSQQQQIQNIKFLQILYRKGQNKIWCQFLLLGQEPTFKLIDFSSFFSILSHNLGRSSGHHRWIRNNPFLSWPVFSCPSWAGKVHSCPLFDIVFPPLLLSVSFSFSFHCAL